LASLYIANLRTPNVTAPHFRRISFFRVTARKQKDRKYADGEVHLGPSFGCQHRVAQSVDGKFDGPSESSRNLLMVRNAGAVRSGFGDLGRNTAFSESIYLHRSTTVVTGAFKPGRDLPPRHSLLAQTHRLIAPDLPSVVTFAHAAFPAFCPS
jgi:hypothetical protein